MAIIYTDQRSKKKRPNNAQRRELQDSWNQLLKKYDVPEKPTKVRGARANLKNHLVVPAELSTRHIPSRDSGAGNATKKQGPTYTGDKIVGIATMHKSNLVPVFNTDDAKSVAQMRRG